MDDFIAGVYVREILEQARLAQICFGHMNAALRRNAEAQEVFFYAHAFLSHTANVSKLLWTGGQRGKVAVERATRRCEHLRAMLGVANITLIEKRDARNRLEHYDEWLDTWVEESQSHNLIDMIISDPGGIAGAEPTDMFRFLDPNALTFTFRGETFNLREMATALSQIENAANAWKETQWWGRK